MNLLLIYPKWPKLERQVEFHLPPHGPVVFAATLPDYVDVTFVDDNLEELNYDANPDVVALSVMLTCQLPRAFEIAREFRERGIPVLMGGIAATLHADECEQHVDSLFVGESEGRTPQVIQDLQDGKLKKRYDYLRDFPPIDSIGPARRDILNYDLYNYRGVKMVDLVHASRGCQFNCFPCCTGYLGGKMFRPRPVQQFIDEIEAIPNNRLFVVDNSLSHSPEWLKELFTAMIPLKKKWVSHPVLYDEEIIELAAEAGCWYVYQAVFDTSDVIRDRIRMLKKYGIGIEGTIILGTDEQDEDYIKRLVDFLLEEELDVAEFTIMTPFLHSPMRTKLEKQGRILSNDWSRYTADKVVFQPKRMSPEKLQEMYYYAWETFYANGGYALRMGNLLRQVISREMDDGTYRRYDPRIKKGFARKNAEQG